MPEEKSTPPEHVTPITVNIPNPDVAANLNDFENGFNAILQKSLNDKIAKIENFDELMKTLQDLSRTPSGKGDRSEYVQDLADRYFKALTSSKREMLQEISADRANFDDNKIRDLVAVKVNNGLIPDAGSPLNDNVALNILSEAVFKEVKKQIAAAESGTSVAESTPASENKLDQLFKRLLDK